MIHSVDSCAKVHNLQLAPSPGTSFVFEHTDRAMAVGMKFCRKCVAIKSKICPIYAIWIRLDTVIEFY